MPSERDSTVDPVSVAVAALSGLRHNVPDALAHVPDAPGLYAVYGTRDALAQLGIDPERWHKSLYVGKAEDSLVRRDLRTHFATGRTGSSTVRRSFAALLRDSLGLRGVPRKVTRPERLANYGLTEVDDKRLTAWMHEHLQLAVWPKPPGVVLDTVETGVIRAWTPPLNIAKNPRPLAEVKSARKVMADDARGWVQTNL